MSKAATAAADSGKGAEAGADAAKPSLLYRLIPHRELVVPEAIFDGIVCVLALPAGIFFFASALASGPPEQEAEPVEKGKASKVDGG
jgi:hypothetical protein